MTAEERDHGLLTNKRFFNIDGGLVKVSFLSEKAMGDKRAPLFKTWGQLQCFWGRRLLEHLFLQGIVVVQSNF